MPVDPGDYTKQAIIDRLGRVKENYERTGNVGGIAAAQQAINDASLASTDADARQIEVAFNIGEYGPDGGDPVDPVVCR